MIFGIGTDMCDIGRIEKLHARFGQKFITRILCAEEQAIYKTIANRHQNAWLAKRFAAKEAGAKALGTGMGRHYIAFTDITITSDRHGKPAMELHGAARAYLKASIPENVSYAMHVSLSDERNIALAFVTIDIFKE